MKNLKLNFNVFMIAILVSIYFSSCEVSKEDNVPTALQENTIPIPIGHDDGHPIYKSTEFLDQLDELEDLNYPYLMETEESEYMIEMEESNLENNADSRGVGDGTYGVKVLNPFATSHTYTGSSEWVPPAHHTPWHGHWAADFWRNYGTCNRNVFMHAQIYNINGKHFESLIGKVEDEGYACASGQEVDGGHMQKIRIYGVKNGKRYTMGWVLFAHIENSTFNYNEGDEFTICTYPYRGIVYLGKTYNGWETNCVDKDNDGDVDCCSASCHLHFEMGNFGWSHSYAPANTSIPWNAKVGSGYRWVKLNVW